MRGPAGTRLDGGSSVSVARSSYQTAPTKSPDISACWNTDISRSTCWAEGVSLLGGFVGVLAGADSSR